VSTAAASLKSIADDFERALSRAPAPAEVPNHFWERPRGLELEFASYDRIHEEFVVWFRAGGRYRLPARSLHESGDVIAVQLDEYRHGVLVAFSDGRTTSIASDFVLFECEPAYGAAVAVKSPEASVGATIRELRIASHRTAAEVASAAGMAAPNFARLEAGHHRPRIDTLVRVAAALNVPLGRLFRR
jgi:DNA-binding XRE family transcriptional regulator